MENKNKSENYADKAVTREKKQWQTPELFIEDVEDITEGGGGANKGQDDTFYTTS